MGKLLYGRWIDSLNKHHCTSPVQLQDGELLWGHMPSANTLDRLKGPGPALGHGRRLHNRGACTMDGTKSSTRHHAGPKSARGERGSADPGKPLITQKQPPGRGPDLAGVGVLIVDAGALHLALLLGRRGLLGLPLVDARLPLRARDTLQSTWIVLMLLGRELP